MAKTGPSPDAKPGAAQTLTPWQRTLLLGAWCGLMAGGLALTGLLVLRPGKSSVPGPDSSLPIVPKAHLDPAVSNLIEQAEAALRFAPRDGTAWGRLGMILHVHELLREARTCYAQAESYQSQEPRWPYFQGQLWLVENQELALQKFEQAARLSAPGQDFTKLRLAQLLVERGQSGRAAACLRPVLDREPDHAAARLEMGRIEILQGHLDQAQALLAPCLTNRHTAKAAYGLFASVQRKLGQPEASAQAEQAARAFPEDQPWPDAFELELMSFKTGKQAWIEHCQVLLRDGQATQAEPIVQQLITRYPEAAEGWLYLGRLRLLQGNLSEAQNAWQRHLQLEPNSFDGHLQMGLLGLRQNRLTDAAMHLERALQSKPDSEVAHHSLGVVRAKENRLDDALASLTRAIQCQPAYMDAYLALATVLKQLGRADAARAQLEAALRINPFDRRIQSALEQLR